MRAASTLTQIHTHTRLHKSKHRYIDYKNTHDRIEHTSRTRIFMNGETKIKLSRIPPYVRLICWYYGVFPYCKQINSFCCEPGLVDGLLSCHVLAIITCIKSSYLPSFLWVIIISESYEISYHFHLDFGHLWWDNAPIDSLVFSFWFYRFKILFTSFYVFWDWLSDKFMIHRRTDRRTDEAFNIIRPGIFL